MLEFKILNNNDIIEIQELDKIRLTSYGLDEQITVYKDQIKNGSLTAVEVLYDNKIIGGAYLYISSNTKTLNISKIFILQEFRNNNYASKLLDYIFNNINYFEEYYNIEANSSLVEPDNIDLIEFYKKNGYREPNRIGIMRRPIYHYYSNTHIK